MGIFDDGIDAEEMGLIGALSEELAEERRELRRLRREIEGGDEKQDEEEEEDPLPRRRRGNAKRRPRGPTGARNELFWRWLNEVKRGLKGYHDSMYGPPRSPEDGRPLATDVDFFGVRIQNAHLVSDRLMHLIYVCMSWFPEHALQTIVFTQDGTPAQEGSEQFGTFDPVSRTITINLRKHFESAVRVIEHENNGCSLIGLIWKGMAQTFLHEFAHALDTVRHPDRSRPHAEREDFADGWSAELATFLATQGQLEPPAAAEEPYFGPRVTRHIAEGLASGWGWAKRQKMMQDAGWIYWDESRGIRLKTEKQFHELSLAGQQEGDDEGSRLNESLQRGKEREEEAWDREEAFERSLREAMYGRRRIELSFRVSDSETCRLTGTPVELVKEGVFPAVRLMTAEGETPVTVRIDRISDVTTAADGPGAGR